MLPLVPLILTVFLLSLLFYNHIIYPLFLSPLSEIPSANTLSRLSYLWIRYHRRNGKTGIQAIIQAHHKHGPIILLSPTELSITSLSGLRTIYLGAFQKTSFYTNLQNYGHTNLVSMLDNKAHTVQKRILANVYSKSFIQNNQDVRRLSTLLVERLGMVMRERERDSGELDAYSLNQAIGADFASAFLFGVGKGTDFLRGVGKRKWFMGICRIKMKELPGHEEASKVIEEFVLGLCRGVEIEQGETKPLVWKVLNDRLKKVGVENGEREMRVASEMFDHFVASIETTRIVLTYLEWELSKNVELQDKLRKELMNLEPSLLWSSASRSEKREIPDLKAIDALPFMNAILKEALRLYPPSPALLPRFTPPEGTVLEECAIPGGITVGTSAYCMHQNEDIFKDSKDFKPERWLETGSFGERESLKEMNRWFWAFGSGGRMCIGSHFALHMLKLCIAFIYTNYRTTVIDDEGIEQEDSFLAGPVGEKLVLRLQAINLET